MMKFRRSEYPFGLLWGFHFAFKVISRAPMVSAQKKPPRPKYKFTHNLLRVGNAGKCLSRVVRYIDKYMERKNIYFFFFSALFFYLFFFFFFVS